MRKLLVFLPELKEALREKIRSAAEGAGLACVFCDAEEDALREAAEAEIILGQSRELALQAKALRWFCTPSAGVNHLQGAIPDGAVLTNSSGAYGVTIAEHTIMVSLELMRRQAEYNAIVSRRAWARGLPVTSLHGARITLVGTGDIGRECALRLRAFRPRSLIGINRSGANPEGLFDEALPVTGLDEALPRTDLLILSLPETPETIGLLNRSRLEALPESAILVNVGRGSALDQKALESLLRAGRLRGAALDVFEKEPLDPEDSLWTCPNLLITPHVAGNMTLPYTVERITELFLEDLERYQAGLPLRRQVDLHRGY